MSSTVYRVVRITTNDLPIVTTVTTEVVWQGTDIMALSRQYPPSEIFSADPLGYRQIEDGWIRFDSRFEKLNATSLWEKCDDPRIRLNLGLSNLEMEIEAENRRDFPGDYVDCDDSDDIEDEDDYDGPCLDCGGPLESTDYYVCKACFRASITR